jgi:uncharacterized membrane protein
VDWYLPLKLVHVLAAIIAVGTNVTYFVWLAFMRGRSQTDQVFALESIARLDARVANPAYFVLPITGIVMVLIGDIGFTTFWVAVAIGLYVLVAVFAAALFVPALRRLTAIVETEGTDAPGYEEAARRTRSMGLLTMLPVAGILYLMVLKPTP